MSIIDPHDRTALEGYYGGRMTDQVASAVVRARGGGWRLMRVHPTAVKLLGWYGRVQPQPGAGKWGCGAGGQGEDAKTLLPNADTYDQLDGDQYCEEEGHAGEEEPALHGEQEEPPAQGALQEEVLAPGRGVVVQTANEEPYIAHVLKTFKKTLHAARLDKDQEGK